MGLVFLPPQPRDEARGRGTNNPPLPQQQLRHGHIHSPAVQNHSQTGGGFHRLRIALSTQAALVPFPVDCTG